MPVLTGLTSGTSATDGTQFTTASVSPTANRLLLLAVLSSREDTTTPEVPSAITGSGLTWVQVATVAFDVTGAIRSRLTLLRAMGAAPSSGTIVITFPNVHSACSWSLVQSDADVDTGGTNGSAAIVQSATASGLTVTLAAFGSADNATYGCFGSNVATAWTPGAGFTEIHDVIQSGAATSSLLAEYKDANDTTVDASGPIGDTGGIAVEIKAGTGGAASLTLTVQRTVAGEVDEGADYDFKATLTLPTAIDLTERVRTFNVRRGRNGSLDRFQAGTASVTYKNGDGAPLDPGNVDSPYYPNVRVLAEQTLARRINGVTYHRFRGRVERFIPEWVPPSYQEQQVEAADAFEALSSLKLVSDHATLTTALAGANNDLVFTARQAGDRGDEITIEYVVSGNNTPLDGAVNDPLQAAAWLRFLPPSIDVTSIILGRQDILPPATGGAVGFELRGSEIAIQVSTDGSGAATTTASDIKSLIEANPELDALVTVALAAGNSGAGIVTALAPTALAGGKWPQEFTGARINRALDVVGWPSAKRRIDSGLFEVVAQGFAEEDNASALSHCQDCADSDLGYFFVAPDGYVVFHDGGHRGRETRSVVPQATFSDANTGAGYVYHTIEPEYSHDHVFNRVSVTAGYQGATPQVVEDATSQLLYSPVPGIPVPRDYAKQTLLADDAGALAVAEAILAARKDAKVRFPRISLFERDEPSGWPSAVYGREIGDLVTLETQPPGHTSTGSYDCFIEEIVDDGSPGVPSEVTFGLSLVSEGLDPEPGTGGALKDSTGDDFILDSATLGVLG